MSWAVWNVPAHLSQVGAGNRWTKVASEGSVSHSSQKRLCFQKQLLGKQIGLGKTLMSIVFYLSHLKDQGANLHASLRLSRKCMSGIYETVLNRKRKTHLRLFDVKTAVHLSGVTSAVVPFLLQFWFHLFENYPVKSR